MSLMTLIRLLLLMLIGWVLAALVVGAMGVELVWRPAATEYVLQPSHQDVMPAGWPEAREHLLVDRTTGESVSLTLPQEYRWSMLAVSPWRDGQGNLEAVGRWTDRDSEAFCGLGLLRLADATVLNRISLDVLPTSRPCWIPGQPGTILYAAADGRLHRYRFARRSDQADIEEPEPEGSGKAATTRALVWRVRPPGSGGVILTDPVWSFEPRLRRRLIVSLSLREAWGNQRMYEPPKLWWLELNNQADAILAAGPLTRPAGDAPSDHNRSERQPTIAVDLEGTIRLVYLTRGSGATGARLHSAELEFDPRTGVPRLVPAEGVCRVLGKDLAMVPLLVSSDGHTIFGLSQSGAIASFRLAE
jgi:hypothetical protein